jgi:hypothetical protein
VSPWITSTWSGVVPTRSATICANDVSRPWPCGAVPLYAVTAPDARRREAADLHPGREPDAQVLALRARLVLLAPERVDVDVRQQLVERPVVVAGVVDEPDRHLGREVLGRDEVLAP